LARRERDESDLQERKTLFGIMLAVSLLIWAALVIGTVGMALVYGLLFFISYCFAQSALVSYLKGTAVQITPAQFPDLYQRIEVCCQRLGLAVVPEAYLLQMGGAFNAFATRFLGQFHRAVFGRGRCAGRAPGRDQLLHRPRDRPHQAQPPALVGAAGAGGLAAAAGRGLCARGIHLRPPRLPCLRRSEKRAGRSGRAGGRRQALAPDERSRYTAQAQQSGGFWMSFHELVGDYPWLVKRMAVVRGLAHGNEVPPAGPSRPGLSAGLFVPRLGVGGAGSCWR
jgi:hypothetical protein